jgi:beta-N-acetylhexosaminidase
MPYHNVLEKRNSSTLVMIGHLMNTDIDDKYPASLSKRHIQYLKNTLKFDGLIITDDLNMGALYKFSRNKSKIARMALEAGNDLILYEYLTFPQIDRINAEINNELSTNDSFKKQLSASIDRINTALIFE